MDRLFIVKGEKVLFRDKECTIVKLITISTISIEEVEINIIHTVSIDQVKPFETRNYKSYSDQVESLSDKDFPLSVVQIDHIQVDIILVDEYYRKPYKRPWLTVAIDVYSRIVLGFYLSFEAPGALATGICIANSILPKEMWLERMGVNVEWSCWGIIDKIHVDNAKEFRCEMLRKTCNNYGIDIEFRPIGAPHWGGHVERLLGTFSKEIHNLPSTTFLSEAERMNYKSEEKSAFTLGEFEKWLTVYITRIYNKRNHSSLGMSPLEKYQEGILGTSELPGKGVSPRINNERKTRIDFLPFVERTVQEYGIVIDHIYYYSDVLRPYIHDQKDKKKIKHLFKRDPRDISLVYFYDPNTEDYFEVPYRNTSLPPISLWEYRDVVNVLKKNQQSVSEASIFSTYRELDELERKAVRETKKRRRFKDQDLPESFQEDSDTIILDSSVNKEEILPFEDLEDEAFRS